MIKKGFIVFMAFAMVLSFSVVVAPAAGAASDGDLIKMDGHSAVYYLNGGKRYVFPNQKTYMTWYTDFSGVVTVSRSEMEGYPLGGNATYRAGTRMVKIDTVPTVYAVEPGGVLRSILSEANATTLYGSTWNQQIDDVPDAFFVNYTVGTDLTAGSYPTGSLVKEEGSATTYYIDGSQRRPIATGVAFDANSFNWSFLQTASSLSGYTDGTSITGVESALITVAGVGGVATGGSVTVSIASDTPASTTYLGSQARAPFLYVNVVNGSSADVTIDSVVLERGGLAVDADFASVGLVEDSVAGTQVGLNKTFNSDHRATVGDDVVVKAGTTKKLIVVGNMNTTALMTAGDTPKLGIYSMALKGGATLNGTFPIWGNTMSLNTGVTIASAAVVAGSSNPTTDNTPKVGDVNEELTQIKITNGSATEEIQLEKIVFKQAGTLADSDVVSYSLYYSADGTKLASAAQVDKYIEFDLAATPFNIGKSKSKEFMVKADEIDGGSGRTMQLDIYRNTDVLVKGLSYGAYVIPSFPQSSQPYFDHTIDQTIGNGTLRVEPDSSFVAHNIAESQDGVQLGQWLFTVKGEGVDITNIEALITIAGAGGGPGYISDITNAIFYNVETGAGLTGASDPTGGDSLTGGVTSTDTISLDVGVHKIGLKADLNADFVNDDTIKLSIDPDADLTTTGQVTGNGITETPSTYQDSATLTVKAASVAVSASNQPAAATVIRGTNGLEVANIQLDATASGDDISITQLKTVIHGTYLNTQELSNLKIWDGSTELSVTNDPDSTLSATEASSTSAGWVTTTWSFSPAVTVTKGTVKTLKVTLNVASTPSAGETFSVGFQSGSTVTAKDSAGEDASKSYTYSDGQTMTIQTAGTLTITRSDTMTDAFLNGSTAGVTLGKFKAKALYEDINIEKMYVNFTAYNSGGTDELTAFYLYDGATQIAEATITSSDQAVVLFNMEGSPYNITVNMEKELTLKADTAAIDKSGGATNAQPIEGFYVSIASGSVTAKGASGQSASVTSATLTYPNFALVKSQPTVTIAQSGDSITGNGTYDLIDVTVAADSKGPVGIYKMTFRVSTTTVTESDLQMYEGTTLVATEDSDATEGINNTVFDGYDLYEVYFNLGGAIGGRMREVSAGTSKTYSLSATITDYNSSLANGVATSMTGDAAIAAQTYTLNAVAVDAVENNDFIWSDLAYGNTSTTATTTVQFLNGYLVDGLINTTSSAKSI